MAERNGAPYVRLRVSGLPESPFTDKMHFAHRNGKKTECGMILYDGDEPRERHDGLPMCRNCLRVVGAPRATSVDTEDGR